MVLDFIAVLGGDLFLQTLNLGVAELDDFSAFHADHVVVMLAAVEFIDGSSAFEVVLLDQTGSLELGQYPVDRGQSDVFPVG